MTVGAVIAFIAGISAVIMASSILARDPGQRANRLVALVLACSAHWSLCEFLWNLLDDPSAVLWLVRLSGAGWLWLAPLTLEVFVELSGDARSPARRLIPVTYGLSAASVLLYFTPWCIDAVVKTPWGWGYTFGPLFPLVYLSAVVPVSLALTRWPGVFSHPVTTLERREARLMFVGIGVPLIAASLTDVILPYMDIHPPRLGSASIVLVGAVVAKSIRKHGFFALAPGAFTHEILETLRDGIALLGSDGIIRAASESLSQLSKTPSDDLVGSSIDSLIPSWPTEIDGASDLELELETSSNARVPVSVSMTLLRDMDQQTFGVVVVIRDMREVENLRRRLVTSGRLTAVGELAAGIAHEINNPITYARSGLIGLGQLFETLASEAERVDPSKALVPIFEEAMELIEESIEGVDRVCSVVRDVGEISYGGPGRSEPVNINELFDNTVNVASLSFSVVVERNFAELPLVNCNPQQLKQVLLNLLLNALQAMGDFGTLRLTTEMSDGWVWISVEDDGCGIPSESIDRIFDPFFTTRSEGEGTGLGLALCYQMIRHHGGEINVTSEPGIGSTFKIQLPRESPGTPPAALRRA